MKGWILTIDGCPYAAATESVPSFVAYVESGNSFAPAIRVNGSLSAERMRTLSWTEEIKPAMADLTVDQIMFALDDVVVTSGPAAGKRVWSWTFSREARSIMQAPLLSDTGTEIVIEHDPGFSSGSQVIWIDREAILCSAFNPATKTFAVQPGGRGYLGTRYVGHKRDDANAYAPIVWAEYPPPQRRRVILWLVNDNDTAVPVWRGYLGRAPRLAQDGARWELQADHAWTVHQNRALGPVRQSVKLCGYQPSAALVGLGFGDPVPPAQQSIIVQYDLPPFPWPRTLHELASFLERAVNARIPPPVSGVVRVSAVDNRLRVESRLSHAHSLSIMGPSMLSPARRPQLEDGVEWRADSREDGPMQHRAVVRLPYTASALIRLSSVVDWPIPVDTTIGLPVIGLSISTDRTTVQWVLVNESDDSPWYIALESVDAINNTVRGRMRWGSVSALRPSTGGWPVDILLNEPRDVALATRVESDHWINAFRYGAFSSFGVDDQADPRDWDFGGADSVIAATGGRADTARVWLFDGNTKLGEFLRATCRIDVCSVVLRGSRLAIESMDVPLASDRAVYTIDLTKGDGIHKSVPGWSTLPEGIVNTVRVRRDNAPTITVNNQASSARYGLSQPFEVDANGALGAMLEGLTPFELARGALSRVLGMWGEPCTTITVDLPIDTIATVELGRIMDVISRTLPKDGVRGVLAKHRGRVISRRIDLGAGTVRVTLLVYPFNASGYAPAFRVSAINGALVQLAASFLSGTATHYAGSDVTAGVAALNAGDVVRFRVVDSTTSAEEGGFTVTDVFTVPPSIKVTPSPSSGVYDWPALLAGGNTIEVVIDDYDAAGLTDNERAYTYVGDSVSRTLNGDRLREFAP